MIYCLVFRIGKPLDHILLIDRIIKREKDDLARNLLITKSIGFGGWLLLDSIQWVGELLNGIVEFGQGAQVGRRPAGDQ